MKKRFCMLLLCFVWMSTRTALAADYLERGDQSYAEYFQQIVAFVEGRGIYTNTPEWQEWKAKQFADLPTEKWEFDLAINRMMPVAGGPHSFAGTMPPASDVPSECCVPIIESVAPGIDKISFPSIDLGVMMDLSGDEYTDMYQRYMQAVHDFVSREDLEGVIIDLRHNYGGADSMLAMITPFLQEGKQFSVVDASQREYPIELTAQSLALPPYHQNNPYSLTLMEMPKFTGKIAVLVNQHTFSMGEYMAFMLQNKAATPDIKLFGQKTAGMLSMNNIIELDDHKLLILTVYQTKNLDGELVKSVEPDIVTKTPEEDAIQWLQQEIASEHH